MDELTQEYSLSSHKVIGGSGWNAIDHFVKWLRDNNKLIQVVENKEVIDAEPEEKTGLDLILDMGEDGFNLYGSLRNAGAIINNFNREFIEILKAAADSAASIGSNQVWLIPANILYGLSKSSVKYLLPLSHNACVYNNSCYASVIEVHQKFAAIGLVVNPRLRLGIHENALDIINNACKLAGDSIVEPKHLLLSMCNSKPPFFTAASEDISFNEEIWNEIIHKINGNKPLVDEFGKVVNETLSDVYDQLSFAAILTPRSTNVMKKAREVAKAYPFDVDGNIYFNHIFYSLLAVGRTDGSVAAAVLISCNYDLQRIYNENIVMYIKGSRSNDPTQSNLCLQAAYGIAKSMGDDRIGTEHILLATLPQQLVSVEESEKIKNMVYELLGKDGTGNPYPPQKDKNILNKIKECLKKSDNSVVDEIRKLINMEEL